MPLLSVLDVAPVISGGTVVQALRNCIDLATHAERLGYGRFWVAEHHNMESIASSAPEVLISHIASRTSRIRVGSGGVMLPNHSSLLIAERFGTLEALHPGRIDLGLGRAPGTDRVTTHAVRKSLTEVDFAEQLEELLCYFRGAFPEDHPYRSIQAIPGNGSMPKIHLLGSSGYSASLAGTLGMPFAFAHHFSADNTVAAMQLYRDRFRPSEHLEKPHAIVAVSVWCADTDEEAASMASSAALSFVRRRRGVYGKLPSVDEVKAYDWTPDERAQANAYLATQVLGSPSRVRAGLLRLQEKTRADELMILTMSHDYDARVRSFELVADVMSPSLLIAADTNRGARGDHGTR